MTGRIERPAQGARLVGVLERRLDGSPHQLRQPEWTCHGCAESTPWPCDPARERLAQAYRRDRPGLAILMAGLLHYAAGEMTNTPPAELFTRFVGWTRYGSHP